MTPSLPVPATLPVLLLAAWVATLVVLAVVILGIAKLAFGKAQSKDVPQVLAGMSNLIKEIPWLRHLANLANTHEPGGQGPSPRSLTGPLAGRSTEESVGGPGGSIEDGDVP